MLLLRPSTTHILMLLLIETMTVNNTTYSHAVIDCDPDRQQHHIFSCCYLTETNHMLLMWTVVLFCFGLVVTENNFGQGVLSWMFLIQK
jgi:hypothetical protein